MYPFAKFFERRFEFQVIRTSFFFMNQQLCSHRWQSLDLEAESFHSNQGKTLEPFDPGDSVPAAL